MRIKDALKVGLVFGAAAIVGGVATAAVTSLSAGKPAPEFSTDPLIVFQDESSRVDDLATLDLGEPMRQVLDGAVLHLAAQLDGATAYVAQLTDGSLCVLAASAQDGTAMTCGTTETAAGGHVALRTQDRPDDPSLFVGIAPNDVSEVEVDGISGVVANNAFIAVGGPGTDTFILHGDRGQRVSVDMAIDEAVQEAPGAAVTHP